MHTVSVFSKSVAINTTLDTLTPIPDQVVTINNNAIVPFTDRRLLAGYVGGVGLTQALLSSPTLLQNGRPAIYPIDSGAIGGNLPATYRPMQRGLMLPGREQTSLLASHAGAGSDTITGVLFHTPIFRPAPQVDYKTIPATATGALGNGAWSLLTFALTAGLARGRYTCVGMAVEGTNCLAARLVFPEQKERPGCLCTVDATLYEWDDYRYGNMGVFGDFDNDNLPQIEIFGVGVLSGTVNIYLDIVPTPRG